MNGKVDPPNEGMTAAQRADLASLLAQVFLPRNIEFLAERVLGDEAAVDIGRNKPPIAELASLLVERLHQTDHLAEAVAILKMETRNGNLLAGLNQILAGLPLAGLAALQANVQAPDDPFFSNDFIELYYPRVQRTVCAIGLGPPRNQLMGTGFLIAPDLVMTNFHVVGDYLQVQEEAGDDKITTATSGENIYCFFDYLSAPRPRIPPEPARPHPSLMVRAAANDWLVRARCRLLNEGVPPYAKDARNKYDYAVIKLEKPVGNVPSRRSGGALRGWLKLDSGVSFLDDVGSRIVVLQHPGGAEQLWDVGTYDKLDPSETRIWYSVNTERGASGGPAVDRRGRLYALHNASVQNEDGSPVTMNQGVRIDVILNDLQQEPKFALPPLIEEDPGYWSLSESATDPKPIIGRQTLRESVVKMMAPNGGRILTVTGPKDSGRRFSVDLLKRIVGANVPVIQFTPDDLSALTAKGFVKALANELALPNTSTIPDAKPTESTSRSFSDDLPAWLAKHLAADQVRNPSRYPVWIVIDAVLPEGKRLAWAADIPDLLSALMGPPDLGQVTPELPHLRWLLLGAPNSAFPPTRTPTLVDDLSAASNTNYVEEFVNCMSLAWRSIRPAAPKTPELFETLGNEFVDDAIREKKAIRAYLAWRVSRLIIRAQAGH